MNLNMLVGPIVAAINPWTMASYRQSDGSETAPSGARTPKYLDAIPVRVQKQPLTWKDLQQLQGLNLNGERAAIYVDGDWQAVSRPRLRGGDLIALENGSIWLVAQVLENWFDQDGWAKVACTLQNNA